MKKILISCLLVPFLAFFAQPAQSILLMQGPPEVALSAFPRLTRPGLPPPAGASDLGIIRARIVQELMEPRVEEERVSEFIRTLREDGSWPGINYTDTSRTGFQHSIHMSRLVGMSRAYQKKGTKLYRNRQLKAAFDAALDYWLERDFICENWWWNQIGVPGEMVRVLLIMGEDQFTTSQWEQALRIAGRANLHASGARPSGDRIVIAGILAKKLLAAGDGPQFNEVIKVIEGEIKFSTGRGMQYDYSFHHREDRVNNTLSYGTSYTNAFAEWAEYVAGTSYAFSPASLHQLIDYYLDGICRMLAFDKYPDPGAKNRGITRQGALRPIGSGIPSRLLKASSYRSEELRNIVAVREGKPGTPRLHTTFFWQSEHLTHQRPAYFTSVRMFSSRNHNMEVPYNSEGLLNHYLGNGSNFISRTGTEYYDIFPVFDYHKIPGATLVQHRTFPGPGQIQKAGIRDFVGGVTNGTFGAAAFDFLSVRDSIRARKAWFFFDGKYVCLGAGIASPARDRVATTLNQSLLKTDVVVMAGGKRIKEQKGEHAPRRVSWVWHDSIAYVFPAAADIHVSNQAQTGSWYRINQQSDSPKGEISRDVFKLWIDHGRRPDSATYAYIVLPAVSEDDAARFGRENGIDIIANNDRIQAVEDRQAELAQMVFYTACSIGISGNLVVTSESPGMLMLQRKGPTIREITVSDPSRKLASLHFSVNAELRAGGPGFTARWDPERKCTDISIPLPQGVYAGKSVTVELQ